MSRARLGIDFDLWTYLLAVGSSVAVNMSWGIHKSVGWAALHGLMSWGYVAYRLLLR